MKTKTLLLGTVLTLFVSSANAQIGVVELGEFREPVAPAPCSAPTLVPNPLYTPPVNYQVYTYPASRPYASYYAPPSQPSSAVLPAPVTYEVYRPVLQIASPSSPAVLGRGVLGQPKAYVPGQPIRNFIRYLTL
jgi:hypothetical protein